MTIDIKKYPNKKLVDVAAIHTPASFKRAYSAPEIGGGIAYLQIPKVYIPNEYKVESSNGLLKDGLAIIPSSNLNMQYLKAYMNSYPGVLYSCDGIVDKRKSITIKTLQTIPVRMLSEELQNCIVFLCSMLDFLISIKELSTDRYIGYKIEVLQELRDAIFLEITLPQLFEKFDIYVLGNWLDTLREFTVSYTGNMNELISDISYSMLSPKSKVSDNVKKMRLLLDKITKSLNKKK